MARILAVDDSAAMRRLVTLALKQKGHDVSTAEDGVQALDFAQRQHVDLVVTDVHMPNMDGITLVQELRALESYRYTPILMLTTESSPEAKARGRAAGATGWIVKPFDPERLLGAIAKVLA